MIPVVTPAQMRQLDAAAGDDLVGLIGRAGTAVADAARDLLIDIDGRRVVVFAGPGNNGADGRVAATQLASDGYDVDVIDVGADRGDSALPSISECDLLVDAAFGTGFRGEWQPPAVAPKRVLAVDVPTGLDGLTGRAGASTMTADLTVTFDAAKPGHFLADGPAVCGRLLVAPIGLTAVAEAEVVEPSDIAGLWPLRPRSAHKWSAAVHIVAGQPGMSGAAYLASAAAQRAGAGMVALSTPGVGPEAVPAPIEVVVTDGRGDWANTVTTQLDGGRFHALIVGPGLGRAPTTIDGVRALLEHQTTATVVDGDGLYAVGRDGLGLLTARTAPTVITPHDGEYRTLMGEKPEDDRLAAADRLAVAADATVVLKGGPTIVATPGRMPTLVTNGDQRLATAGTGDVLAGIIGALLAQGLDSHEAAVAGVFVHAAAANRLPPLGMVASDLIDSLVGAINDTVAGR